MKCKKHPKYEAKRKPVCDCPDCWDIWNAKIGINDNENLIPDGIYCYNGKEVCPFYNIIFDHSVSIPFCSFLKKGDVFGISDGDFRKLCKIHKNAANVWEKYSLDLLWDQVKECGININEI